MQGIAGSLAGFAALSAVGASAKKKNKKAKGSLVRVEIEENTQSIPADSAEEVTATCPEPGDKESVFVLGGGFATDGENVSQFFIFESRASLAEASWILSVANENDVAARDATAQVICGYFRK